MIAGLDGLAGGLGLIALLFLVPFASNTGDTALLLTAVAAIAAFLPFNVPALFTRQGGL